MFPKEIVQEHDCIYSFIGILKSPQLPGGGWIRVWHHHHMPTSSRAILLKSYLYVNPNISKVLLFFITVFQESLFPHSSHMTLYFFAIKIFNESLKNNLGRTCIILRPFLLIYAQFRLVCPRDILVDASRIASVCIVIIIAKLPCSFQGSRARLIPGLFSSTQVEWKDIFI